ncbi:MAG: cyanophycin synthetase, partial [Gammaproteobacteria bacterium]|nr:cyanophycin synthetase [Gammaproteobacteria bacterium]
ESVFKAIHAAYPERRLVVIFQPHRYTRTCDLFEDFATVLAQADVLVLSEVYAAGETPIPGADGRSLTRAVRLRSSSEPVFVENFEQLPAILNNLLQDNDVLLTLGAGDVGSVPARLMREFQS